METLYDFFAKPTDPKRYNAIRIALASPTLYLLRSKTISR